VTAEHAEPALEREEGVAPGDELGRRREAEVLGRGGWCTQTRDGGCARTTIASRCASRSATGTIAVRIQLASA